MTLSEARKNNFDLGKDKFIKKLVKDFKESISKKSVIDLIEDHLGLYPEYRSEKLLNKIRKMNKRDAQKEYVLYFKNDLMKKSLEELVDSYT